MKAPSNAYLSHPIDGERRSINSELWHACAGPLVSLPLVGRATVNRSAKEASSDNRMECVCKCKETSRSCLVFIFSYNISRDEKSQLLLGIRRANRQQAAMSSSVLSSDSMHIGVLAAAAHAASNHSPFTVFYNPRASPSEFVIPLSKYNKAILGTQISLGMRFRMMFETEESGVRRYMGTITGIRDLDPERWPNSQWRNIQVGWDESSAGERQNRVSIWEIEPVVTPFFICPPPFFRPKRPRHPGMLASGAWAFQGGLICLPQRLFSPVGYVAQSATGVERFFVYFLGHLCLPFDQLFLLMTTACVFWRISSNLPVWPLIPTSQLCQQLQQPAQQLQQQRLQQQQSQQIQQQQQLLPLSHQYHQHQTQPPAPVQQHVQNQFPQYLHTKQNLQQSIQLPEMQGQLLQSSSIRSQAAVNMPLPAKAQSGFTNSYPLQNGLTRAHQSAIISEERPQYTNMPKASASDTHAPVSVPNLVREPQVTSWLPSVKEPNQAALHTYLNAQLGQMETSSSSGASFSLPQIDAAVPQNLQSLPLQSSPFLFRDASQDSDMQTDPRSNFLFGVNIESPLILPSTSSPLLASSFSAGKDSQNHLSAGNLLTSFSTVKDIQPQLSAALGSQSFGVPDLPFNSVVTSDGGMSDGNILQRGSWQQPLPPMRTYTKHGNLAHRKEPRLI